MEYLELRNIADQLVQVTDESNHQQTGEYCMVDAPITKQDGNQIFRGVIAGYIPRIAVLEATQRVKDSIQDPYASKCPWWKDGCSLGGSKPLMCKIREGQRYFPSFAPQLKNIAERYLDENGSHTIFEWTLANTHSLKNQ